ncbi:hypothetical protein HDU76_007541 [Blyttiomyces sp. JEL0837]|nr:hypothetical protein HDU76_007541 [Blyttiomyces sp. JEL0837]
MRSSQVKNLQVLEVKLDGKFTAGNQATNVNHPDKVATIKQLFAWLMPNLEELKVHEVLALRKKEVPGFLDSAFTALAWFIIDDTSQSQFMHHLSEFQNHVVNVHLNSGLMSDILRSLLDAQGQPIIANGFRTWFEMMEGEKLSSGGIRFPKLQTVTLVSYYDSISVDGKTLQEATCYIQSFVDPLPETVVKIRVSGVVRFEKSDITDILVQYSKRRGIKVIVGNFKNPSELMSFPRSVKDL